MTAFSPIPTGLIANVVLDAAHLASMARLVGGWRIAEMDLWDSDVIELLGRFHRVQG